MIEFDGVSKRFGSQGVLRGVTLRIPAGSSLALLGPSGAGKSVLLKTVIGLIEPDEGDVRVAGRSVLRDDGRALAAVRRQVGYIFQSSALFDSLSVEENVLLGLDDEVCRTNPQWCRQRVEQCLRWVNLEPDAAAKYPAELSGGMQKRVAIARAIAGNQRYLLCDEPTTGLDPMNAALIAELLRRLQQQLGATSIIVTHDLSLARFVTDRFALLFEGRIRAHAPADEFLALDDPVVRSFTAAAQNLQRVA